MDEMYHEISGLTHAESHACFGALPVWNQSCLLMHGTGVIQVTTLTAGLLLPTAASLCAPEKS